MGWYNSSWKYKHKITIPASKVSADITDYEATIDLANLSAAFWGKVKNGGGDIRVTSSNGTTELPREVVSCNTATNTGQLHFKATGTLSSTVDNVFYIYFGNAAATEPAADSTYGSENAWSNWSYVGHAESDMSDSTGNDNDEDSSTGTITTESGKLGNSRYYTDGAYSNHGDNASMQASTNLTAVGWIKGGTTASQDFLFGQYSVTGSNRAWCLIVQDDETLRAIVSANGSSTWKIYDTGVTVKDSDWHQVGLSFSANDLKIYVDGAVVASPTLTADSTVNSIYNSSAPFSINARDVNASYGDSGNTYYDEVRVTTSQTKSAAWFATSFANQNSPSTFYTVGSIEFEDLNSNWYNASWAKRSKLEINPAKIAGSCVDFPMYVDLAELPATFFTNVKSAGEDIRITNGDGETELAFELVDISTGSETGEVHVKIPDLRPDSGESIYLYYGNAAASAYARTDTYGSNTVWDDYLAVYHLNEDPSGSSPQIKNSTYRDTIDGTTAGSMTTGDLVSAQFAKGLEFDGVNDYIDLGNPSVFDISGTNLQLSAWYKSTDSSTTNHIVSKIGSGSSNFAYCLGVIGGSGKAFFQGLPSNTVQSSSTNLNNGAWRYINGYIDGANGSISVDGSIETTNSISALNSYTTPITIGARSNAGTRGQFYEAAIAEVRWSQDAKHKAAAWIETEYNNQYDASTFFQNIVETSYVSAPAITSVTPADNATDVAAGTNLTIEFSQTVVKGTGNITIKKTSDDSTIETIDVTAGTVTVSTDTVTINPVSDLANSTEFYVLIDSGAFENGSAVDFDGISSTTEWSFTTEAPDLTAPTLDSSIPADNATGVSRSANIVITFDEDIAKGTGNITIKKYSDDSTIETIDVTSGLATVSGADLTINPASDLPNAERVYILVDNTAVEDLAGNAFAGIASKDTLDFTTADTVGPVLLSSNPEAGAPSIAIDSTITLNFDENVTKGTGNITIKRYSDDVVFETIAVGAAAVVVTDADVVITPGSNLASNTQYYVLIDATCFDDASSNSYAGIASKDTLSFNTLPIATETLTPAEDSTGNSETANLEIDFNQDVTVGTGNVTISQRPNLKIGGANFSGDIAEILVVKDQLSESDRQKVEGYLAWKLFGDGSLNPLISNHPFKNRAPTI